jgi:hypothetical protein
VVELCVFVVIKFDWYEWNSGRIHAQNSMAMFLGAYVPSYRPALAKMPMDLFFFNPLFGRPHKAIRTRFVFNSVELKRALFSRSQTASYSSVFLLRSHFSRSAEPAAISVSEITLSSLRSEVMIKEFF